MLRLGIWQGIKCKEGSGVIDSAAVVEKIYNDFLNTGFTDSRQEW